MGKHHISSEPAILSAAEKVFLEKGLEGARTAEIAKAARVNTGVLHYFFKTKEQLYDKIIEERYYEFTKSLLEALSEVSGNLEHTVRAISESMFDFLIANPGLSLFIFKEYPRHPEQIRRMALMVKESPDASVSKLQKELDAVKGPGVMDAGILFYKIVSLNLFSVLAIKMSLDLGITGFDTEKEYIDSVRESNVRTLLERISEYR